MRMRNRYRIIEEKYSEFSERIEVLMDEGWLPQGGIFVKNEGLISERYYQAMVKKDDNNGN